MWPNRGPRSGVFIVKDTLKAFSDFENKQKAYEVMFDM